jgi:hypothetical protein
MPSWSWPLVGPGLAVDLSRPLDLSMAIAFDDAPLPVPAAGAPPGGRASARARPGRAFGLPAAITSPVALGAFVGDVRRGGSCNCETHMITPHGDGTHTEGIGHLLHERVCVLELVDAGLMPALVITVVPARLDSVSDEVTGNHAPDDHVIDELSLQEAHQRAVRGASAHVRARALVVRTAAGETRRAAGFSGTNPPYFTVDAALWVRAQGFEHVLVDVPSFDREDDGGLLGAHRGFFDLAARATHLADGAPPPRRTITEMIAVDARVTDGLYALTLQLAPLIADAVPSRPLLFPLVAASTTWLRP